MTPSFTRTPLWLQLAPPLCVALLAGAWIATVVCDSRTAPGVTLDEPFNVREGTRLLIGIRGWIGGTYTLREVFGDAEEFARGERPPLGFHLPDHPPLGRIWLGICEELTGEPRIGSAVGFAMTVFLVGFVTARWYGGVAGLLASLAMATMPRLFGHAHLASLETVTNLTFTAALLGVAAFWRNVPPRPWVAALTGLLFGLALLTKMQAVFLPLPIALYALARYRLRAVVPLSIWGGVAAAVFFAGWPWLWLDPFQHPLDYFRQTTERVSLHTFYLGTRYLDRDVPWHYSFVMFLLTVPVGWQLAGFVGVVRSWCGKCLPKEEASFRGAKGDDSDDRWRTALILGSLLLPLIVFAVPGVTVYDGARLLLVVFPLWAVFIGRGAMAILESCRRIFPRIAIPAAVALTATSLVPLAQFRPCYLSYYNAAAGGLWGAERLGMEVSYWGDGLTTEFLDEAAHAVPPGATIDVVPLMHQLQMPILHSRSTVFRERNVKLRGYDRKRNGPARYVLFYRRRADLPPELEPLPADARILAAVRRQGVIVAALIELPQPDLLALTAHFSIARLPSLAGISIFWRLLSCRLPDRSPGETHRAMPMTGRADRSTRSDRLIPSSPLATGSMQCVWQAASVSASVSTVGP